MAIKKELLDQLLKDRDPKTMFSSAGLLGDLKKALAERVLNAEMDHHLADSAQDEVSEEDKPANHRNGYSKKTVLTENEALELAIPRDRRGTFDPQLIAKYQRRFPGFDDKIISMYTRGMSTREIRKRRREAVLPGVLWVRRMRVEGHAVVSVEVFDGHSGAGTSG